jgi:hypothetical protein
LPYIEDEAERTPTPSSAPISGKYGFDFDAPSPGSVRRSRAFERMIEHHVYWALTVRWVNRTILPGPAHFFDRVPEHQREKVREDAQFRVAENYLLSGLGRHGPDGCRSRRALAVCAVGAARRQDLPDGEEPCGTDATFGALAGHDAVLRVEPA